MPNPSPRTVAEKGRIAPGTRVAIVAPVPDVVQALGLPPDVRHVPSHDAQLIVLFAQSRDDLERHMASTVESLPPGGTLWVCFRKGSRAAGHEINRNDVWAAAERLGMRPLGLLSVDQAWSVFRLRPGGDR